MQQIKPHLRFQDTSQPFQMELQENLLHKKQRKIAISKKVKRKIIIILVLALVMFAFLKKSWLKPNQCIRDLTHQLTDSLNLKVNEKGDFCYYFLIIGQLFIDIQLIFFFVFLLFKVQNLYSVVWIGLFYGVRALFINIEKFPYPKNIYWQQPGFPPSLGVPYGITRDFFYSGHTGLMLFSCIYWGLKQQTKLLHYISKIGLVYIILVVITTRVHYVIDVFAAITFGLFINKLTWDYLMYFDYFFTQIYHICAWLLSYFWKLMQFFLNLKITRKKKQTMEAQNRN